MLLAAQTAVTAQETRQTSSYQILFICILPGKLISDQMAAIIQIIAVYTIIVFNCMPP